MIEPVPTPSISLAYALNVDEKTVLLLQGTFRVIHSRVRLHLMYSRRAVCNYEGTLMERKIEMCCNMHKDKVIR